MNKKNYEKFQQAIILAKSRSYEEAILKLKSILDEEPDQNIVKLKLGVFLLFTRDLEKQKEGEEILKQLLDTNNKDYACLELGKFKKSIGEYKEAIKYLDMVEKPDIKESAFLEKAIVTYFDEDIEQAKKYFKILVDHVSKNSSFALLWLGKIAVKEEDYDLAREYFEKIPSIMDNRYALIELGKLEMILGNYEMARKHFKKLENTLSRIYAQTELGKLEVVLGNYKEARKIFNDLLCTKSKPYVTKEIICLDIIEKKYIDAYSKLINTKFPDSLKSDYQNIKSYLEYELKKDISPKTYYGKQLFNYDINLAIAHIKEHLVENRKKPRHTIFNEKVDLERLLDYVKDKLKTLRPSIISDSYHYIVECDDEVSNIDGETTKYIKVITLPNSDNILTMFPIKYHKNLKEEFKRKK